MKINFMLCDYLEISMFSREGDIPNILENKENNRMIEHIRLPLIITDKKIENIIREYVSSKLNIVKSNGYIYKTNVHSRGLYNNTFCIDVKYGANGIINVNADLMNKILDRG